MTVRHGIPEAEPLPAVVRAYAPVPVTGDGEGRVEPSEWSVVFDCETTEDRAHSLRFGAFQVRRGDTLRRAGFFSGEALTPAELQVLQAAADDNGLELLELEEFVDEILLRYGYDLTGLCIGFNLPFDISRIARGHVTSASGDAFSFDVSERRSRLRIRVQHRNSSAARIEFVSRGSRQRSDHRGYFVDVKTLAKALTG